MTSKPLYPVPQRTATVGILLFLLSLTMLFASSMLGYFIIRRTVANAPLGTIALPRVLWISTGVIIASSFTLSAALRAIRSERHNAFRRNLLFTMALAVTFVAIQAPALAQLLRGHEQLQSDNVRLYGILFFLVLLHALHVIGGIIMLGIVILMAYRKRYDHENHAGVRNAAYYWHFLDVIWLGMFLSLWAVG